MNSFFIWYLINTFAVTLCVCASLSKPPVQNTWPSHWKVSKRRLYLQSRTGHFLEIYPNKNDSNTNGTIRGSYNRSKFGLMEILSSGMNNSLVIKGVTAGMYLCMDKESHLYASRELHSVDCFFKEDYTYLYNVYHHMSHRQKNKKKKFYIGIDRQGYPRTGIEARKSQKMSQFLPVEHKNDTVWDNKDEVTPRPLVEREKRQREQTRKRRRRWCKLLLANKLTRNPQKFRERCKYDCEILQKMIENPRKYKKRCERQKRKRRNKRLRHARNKKRHGGHRDGRRRRKSRDREHKRTSVTRTTASLPHSVTVT